MNYMSDSIKELLGKRSASEPPEFAVIRSFVEERFSIVPTLSISSKTITVGVPSGAIAGNLRLSLHELKEKLGGERRVIIRIN